MVTEQVSEKPLYRPQSAITYDQAAENSRPNARSKQGGEVCPCSSRMHRIPFRREGTRQ